jgi:hypothetical protein
MNKNLSLKMEKASKNFSLEENLDNLIIDDNCFIINQFI